MENEQLIHDIVSRWYQLGEITDAEKDVLKAEYILHLGAPPSCTTCSAFWHDVQTYFRLYFRQINNPVMTPKKFLIAGDGVLQLPDGSLYTNGPKNPNAEHLTDEVAEYILDQYPDYNQLIVINPDYEKFESFSAEGAADAIDEASTGDSVDAGSSIEQQDNDSPDSEALVELQKKLDAVTSEFVTIQNENGTLTTQIEVLKADKKELTEINEGLQTQLGEMNLLTESIKRELSSTKGQLTKAKNELALVNAQPSSEPAPAAE